MILATLGDTAPGCTSITGSGSCSLDIEYGSDDIATLSVILAPSTNPVGAVPLYTKEKWQETYDDDDSTAVVELLKHSVGVIFFWDNNRGNFIVPASKCAVQLPNDELIQYLGLPVLHATRSKLTCVSMNPDILQDFNIFNAQALVVRGLRNIFSNSDDSDDSDTSPPSCCSMRRTCTWYARKMPDCSPCSCPYYAQGAINCCCAQNSCSSR